MTHTDDDLLPCPFCGGEPISFFIPTFLQCAKCGTRSGYHDSEAKAIAAWNTRANRDEVEDIVMISGLTHIIEAMTEERRWIPVSERLPEIPDSDVWEDSFVLCTYETTEGKRHVTEMFWDGEQFVWGDEQTIEFTAPTFVLADGRRLIAWQYMPLPALPEEVEG